MVIFFGAGGVLILVRILLYVQNVDGKAFVKN